MGRPGRGDFYNDGTTTTRDTIDLGTSPVENVVGGSGPDNIVGGRDKNTLSGGPGGRDFLTDLGGMDGALAANPASRTFPPATTPTGASPRAPATTKCATSTARRTSRT